MRFVLFVILFFIVCREKMLHRLFLYGSLISVMLFDHLACSEQATKAQKTDDYAIILANRLQGLLKQRQLLQNQKNRRELPFADRQNNPIYSAICENDKRIFDAAMVCAHPEVFKCRNRSGETLAHTAIAHHRGSMLEQLMNKKCIDVNAQNYSGQTVAHYAVFHRSNKALDITQAHGANLELQDIDGMTPLALATQLDYPEVVDHLLTKNVHVRPKNKYGHEPLHFAKSAKVVRSLVAKGADLHAQGCYGHTPIALAVTQDKVDAASALVESGARTDYIDQATGNNLLHLARSGAMTQLLLTQGVSIYASNKRGDKPLHCAARLKDPAVVTKIVAAGGFLSDLNSKGEMPLHEVYYLPVAQVMIEAGASVHALAYQRYSPLHSVIGRSGNSCSLLWADIGELFLDRGADMYLKMNTVELDDNSIVHHGFSTVYNLAYEVGNYDMIALLKSREVVTSSATSAVATKSSNVGNYSARIRLALASASSSAFSSFQSIADKAEKKV